MTVNRECGHTVLCVSRHNSRKINSARSFSTVEAPNSLDCFRIHIVCFHTVAPTGCNGKRCDNIFACKLFLALCRFGTAADCRVADNALHGCSVGIAKIFLNELCGRCRHTHCLIFKALTNTAPSSVNNGTNTYFRIFHSTFSFYYLVITVLNLS